MSKPKKAELVTEAVVEPETEAVAESVADTFDPQAEHAAWCAARRAEGWVYGPVFSGTMKTDPRLTDA